MLKTQINITPGNWQNEIISGLFQALDPSNPLWIQGSTITLEREGQDPILIAGIAKNPTNEDDKISLYIEGTYNSRISPLSGDQIFLNSVSV